MPNIQSAKKRMRQNEKRRDANRKKKSAIRTYEKRIRKLSGENQLEEAQKALSQYSSLIDKAAKRNIVHPNTADRKKSRLASLLTKKPAQAAANPAPAVEAEPAEVTETAE